MNRQQLYDLFYKKFGGTPDSPWENSPEDVVFRHKDNRKWYALVMNISSEKLGMPDNKPIDAVNFKCDPAVLGSYLALPGFFPAYHMNKNHWITAVLGMASDEDIISAAELSFGLTMKKSKKK